MSHDSPSFVNKLKSAFSRVKIKRRSKVSSFKTPQDLLNERYGETIRNPDPAPATARKPAPASTNYVARPTTESHVSQSSVPRTTIPRFQDLDHSGDVSPTDQLPLREDRPHSDAVSALDQEEISERLRKTTSVQSVEETLDQANRPISTIAPVDSVHQKTSPITGISLPQDIATADKEKPLPIDTTASVEAVKTEDVEIDGVTANKVAGETSMEPQLMTPPMQLQSTTTPSIVEPQINKSEILPTPAATASLKAPETVETSQEQPKAAAVTSPEPNAKSPITLSIPQAQSKERSPITLEDAPRSGIDPPEDTHDAADTFVEAERPEPMDRIDPTTAPEVVNDFDDEKMPVLDEPVVGSPLAVKFSATSGPLEDFPVGGEYYN